MAKARKSGNIVTGKPCISCAIALRSAGITEVFYSTPVGFKLLDLDKDLSRLKVYRKGERKDA
jgi:deoxycytidylate deaminase